ncbi:3-oxoacyl-[acyl-carrier-protein] reductase [Chloroflexota bacterium]
MPDNELAGRVALVTGASRGLGRAIAVRLADSGARVAVNYLQNTAAAQEVAAQINKAGGEARLCPADVADGQAVRAMVREIVRDWGRLDILVNNAGITRDGLLPRMPEADWDAVLNTHLRGAYLCTKFALRPMMEQQGGRIINITSVAGLVGNAGQANYSAAKGGLIAFTKSIAHEVGSRGITANAVAPGFIVTDMTESLPAESKEAILGRIALKRFGQPQDVAELVAFLAGDRAAYLTAQVISIDGGVL